MTHRAGFVNIIGNPNVGKSTLMNAFVGERLSIITSKAQTLVKCFLQCCKYTLQMTCVYTLWNWSICLIPLHVFVLRTALFIFKVLKQG